MMEIYPSCFTFCISLLILRFAPLHELAFVPGEAFGIKVPHTYPRRSFLLRKKPYGFRLRPPVSS